MAAVILESDTTLILTMERELVRFNLNDAMVEVLVALNDEEGRLRFNNGSCCPSGHFWVGTTTLDRRKGAAALYSFSKNGTFEKVLKGVTLSNGISWSPENTFLYYSDTPANRIQRYRYYKGTGDILLDRNTVKTKKDTGLPDGMTIDAKGNLWVAQWGGFGVYCYNPYTGELLAKVELPAPNVTSCAFGGANLETLYITTARSGLTEEELKKYPLSGSVFSCKVGVKGLRPNYFGVDNIN